MRTCTCENVTGPAYTLDQCRRCWKWRYDPAYNAYCGGGGVVSEPVASCVVTRIEGLSGRSFNGSVAEWRGKTYLCYRKYWSNARLAIVELDHHWLPAGPSRELRLGQLPQDRDAQEDPRLFLHRGRLCVSYTGCNWRLERPVSVCFARLDDAVEVETSVYPNFGLRGEWEKNWGFFDHHGDLYAVYEINPHRVCMENHGEMWELPRLRTHAFDGRPFELMRGGASPVLVGDEYYCFFHGTPQDRSRPYSIGVYTFEAKPPFYPKRWCPVPLLKPTENDWPGPHVAKVVFPGGAILRAGEWHVAFGYYDQEIRIASWRAEDVEKLLIPT